MRARRPRACNHLASPSALWRKHVNRSELARAFAERIDATPRQARETIDSFVDLITETVARGEDVAISGFAKFRRVDRAARIGRNPATGEPVKIKAKRVAKITPLKAFKDAVVSGKAPAKKAPAKKAPARKAPAKKTAAKKAPARKAPAKTAPAPKARAKKTPATKAPARKAPAKKAPARKAPAKKTAAKKAPARKAPAKKTAAKRR